MKQGSKKHPSRIAESIELIATNGPMSGSVSEIPNKNGPTDQFEISETDTEVAITLRYVVLHATKTRGDNSMARNIEKSMRNNEPVRAFADGSALGNIDKSGSSTLEIPLGPLKAVIEKAKSQGKTIRLCKPKEGIPVFFGDDWNERHVALQKKKKR